MNNLPANIEAERLVLGSIVIDNGALAVASTLTANDFSVVKHQIIYAVMLDLAKRRESIDRVNLANELIRRRQLEAVDGMAYLVSLWDSLPKLPNVDGYVRIVKDKSTLRKLIINANAVVEFHKGGE